MYQLLYIYIYASDNECSCYINWGPQVLCVRICLTSSGPKPIVSKIKLRPYFLRGESGGDSLLVWQCWLQCCVAVGVEVWVWGLHFIQVGTLRGLEGSASHQVAFGFFASLLS